MKKYQDARGIAAHNNGPFSAHTVDIDRLKLHIIGHRPDGTDRVQPLSPLGPAGGAWVGT
jgi:hypothetical protein